MRKTDYRHMEISRFTLIIILLLLPFSVTAWEEEGIASWYGGKFQGRKTANGEIYDIYGFTAAHKTLPFGTMVEVVRPDNGMSVMVRINDRGPFVEGRIIDLTYAAAKSIDMIRNGTVKVIVRTKTKLEFPKVKFTIQIGAWSDMENASKSRRKLETVGLTPQATLGPGNIVRLALYEIEEQEINGIVEKLESLGYSNLWIHQK